MLRRPGLSRPAHPQDLTCGPVQQTRELGPLVLGEVESGLVGEDFLRGPQGGLQHERAGSHVRGARGLLDEVLDLALAPMLRR